MLNATFTRSNLESVALSTSNYGAEYIAYNLHACGFNGFLPIRLLFLSNVDMFEFCQPTFSDFTPKNWNFIGVEKDGNPCLKVTFPEELFDMVKELLYVRFDSRIKGLGSRYAPAFAKVKD